MKELEQPYGPDFVKIYDIQPRTKNVISSWVRKDYQARALQNRVVNDYPSLGHLVRDYERKTHANNS